MLAKRRQFHLMSSLAINDTFPMQRRKQQVFSKYVFKKVQLHFWLELSVSESQFSN